MWEQIKQGSKGRDVCDYMRANVHRGTVSLNKIAAQKAEEWYGLVNVFIDEKTRQVAIAFDPMGEFRIALTKNKKGEVVRGAFTCRAIESKTQLKGSYRLTWDKGNSFYVLEDDNAGAGQ